jgi:hypothetical protein
VYIQQDATLHSLFISGNCSACFGWYFHPSSGAHTTVPTASGICHTVTAISRYRGRVRHAQHTQTDSNCVTVFIYIYIYIYETSTKTFQRKLEVRQVSKRLYYFYYIFYTVVLSLSILKVV